MQWEVGGARGKSGWENVIKEGKEGKESCLYYACPINERKEKESKKSVRKAPIKKRKNPSSRGRTAFNSSTNYGGGGIQRKR